MRGFELPLKAARIECLDAHRQPIRGAVASAFVVRETDGLYAYTAWHVATGFRTHPLVVGHAPPTRRFMRVQMQRTETRPGATVIGGTQDTVVSLYDRSEGWPAKPMWCQDEAEIENASLNAIGIRVPLWHDAIKILLPGGFEIADMQTVTTASPWPFPIATGRVAVVGFPFGYSVEGLQQPTPIVLIRHIAASTVSAPPTRYLLDGDCAPGMSGGPTFLETANGWEFMGLYSGNVFPDNEVLGAQDRNDRKAALGVVYSLGICWSGHPLVPYA